MKARKAKRPAKARARQIRRPARRGRRRPDHSHCPEGRAALQAISALAAVLRGPVQAPVRSLPAEGIDLEAHLEATGRGLMLEALNRCAGVQTRAVKLLRMSFRSFRYYRKKYGLPRPVERGPALEPAAEKVQETAPL